MGRKTNPTIIRIGAITRQWDAKWFEDKRGEFRTKLLQDLHVRSYLDKKFRMASISRVEIAREPREIVLTIHSSRPAVVIGRGGSGIEAIQKDLAKILGRGSRVRINVQEVQNPDTDAAAVATQVVDQIERRMPFRRVLKQAVRRAIQAGARGVRVSVAGRLNGAEISRVEWLSEGSVPLQTFRSNITFVQRVAYTTYGTIGVKVWIHSGDIASEEDHTPTEVKEEKRKIKKRKKTSLAEKARETTKVRTKSTSDKKKKYLKTRTSRRNNR